MPAPLTPPELEARYELLRGALLQLVNTLLHASAETEIAAAFRCCLETSRALFEAEEFAMEASGCPALEMNRAGHRMFARNLDNLFHEYRVSHHGLPLANQARTELVSWLHEHHKLVDGQLASHLRRMASVTSDVG